MLYEVTGSALGTNPPPYSFNFHTYISSIHQILALTYHQILGLYRLTDHIYISSGRHEYIYMTIKGMITTMWLKGKPIAFDQIYKRVTLIIVHLVKS